VSCPYNIYTAGACQLCVRVPAVQERSVQGGGRLAHDQKRLLAEQNDTFTVDPTLGLSEKDTSAADADQIWYGSRHRFLYFRNCSTYLARERFAGCRKILRVCLHLARAKISSEMVKFWSSPLKILRGQSDTKIAALIGCLNFPFVDSILPIFN
jgi:hypothetical protein